MTGFIRGVVLKPARWRPAWRSIRSQHAVLVVALASSLGRGWSRHRLRWLAWRCLINRLRLLSDYKRLRKGRAEFDRVHNGEAVRGLLASGSGAVVAAPHLGPFPWVPVPLGQHGLRRLDILMMEQILEADSETFLKLAEEFEGSHLEVLPVQNPRSVLQSIRTMKDGGFALAYPDANYGAGAAANAREKLVDVDFLGTQLSVRSSIAWLAQRADVPILAAAAFRERGGRRVVAFSDPLPPPQDASQKALAETTRQLFGWMEQHIRAHPEQWEGWFRPFEFWRETGSAPTATQAEIEATVAAAQAALGARPLRLRLRVDARDVALLPAPWEGMLYEGAHRRVLRLGPLALELVRCGLGSGRLGAVARHHAERRHELAQEIARLVLAGLARTEPAIRTAEPEAAPQPAPAAGEQIAADQPAA